MNTEEKKKEIKNQKRRKNKSKNTSTKMTKIGTQQFVNKDTGEVETFNIIEEHDQDFNFEKIWLGHLLESLEVLGNAKIKVLNHLLAIKNSDNQIIATQRQLANDVGVSVPVVNETIKKLVQANAIVQVTNGVLMLNPEVIFKGKHEKRMNILLRYSKSKTIEGECEEKEEIKEIKTPDPDSSIFDNIEKDEVSRDSNFEE